MSPLGDEYVTGIPKTVAMNRITETKMKSDNSQPQDQNDAARRRARRVGKLYSNALLYLVLIAALFAVNALMFPGRWWIVWPALGLGLFMLIRAWHVLVTPRFIE